VIRALATKSVLKRARVHYSALVGRLLVLLVVPDQRCDIYYLKRSLTLVCNFDSLCAGQVVGRALEVLSANLVTDLLDSLRRAGVQFNSADSIQVLEYLSVLYLVLLIKSLAVSLPWNRPPFNFRVGNWHVELHYTISRRKLRLERPKLLR
jgi:hypothetical protein